MYEGCSRLGTKMEQGPFSEMWVCDHCAELIQQHKRAWGKAHAVQAEVVRLMAKNRWADRARKAEGEVARLKRVVFRGAGFALGVLILVVGAVVLWR